MVEMPANGSYKWWVIKILEALPRGDSKGSVQIFAEGTTTRKEAEDIAETYRNNKSYGKQMVCHAIIAERVE